jgi:protein-S-isoprenylcysteine O-methyltransferase Ste14
MDRHLLVRAGALYLVLMLTVAAYVWRRPSARHLTAAGLGFVWNAPLILALHVVATRAEWWRFDAEGGLLLGMPVDLWLSWAWLWGAIPVLGLPSVNLAVVSAMALTVDLLLMPVATPVLHLGPAWLSGEAIGLIAGLIPGQLLARWTLRETNLQGRALLQMVAFTGLLLLIIPAIAIEGSGAGWVHPFDRPAWQVSAMAHLLAVPAVIGLSAVQEFVVRGGGTPIPFDPPRRLVTSGVYAYIRNPMQLSAVVLLLLLAVVVSNFWIALAGVMAHLYSAGLAGRDEDEDLRRRFGEGWIGYRRTVRAWVPRFRPAVFPGRDGRLFVAEECGTCQQVAGWFAVRQPRGLTIVGAETHPSRELTRITYEGFDGSTASGVAAIARALEHIHLGWAFVGFLLRLPLVIQLVQLIVDASGGGPTPGRQLPPRRGGEDYLCRRSMR